MRCILMNGASELASMNMMMIFALMAAALPVLVLINRNKRR